MASATDGARVEEIASGRHRPAEAERRDREKHGGDIAVREGAHAVLAGGLEVVDAPRAELDGERRFRPPP